MLVLNATSLRKPNALQHLATELRQTNSDFGFIVETRFKNDDNDGFFQLLIAFYLGVIESVVDVSMAVVCALSASLLVNHIRLYSTLQASTGRKTTKSLATKYTS